MSTRTPVTFYVTDHAMIEWPEIQDLTRQGHICAGVIPAGPALIIGPHAWHITDEHRAYIPVAVKAAQARRRRKDAAS
jgi:hypothetical protein